jgi:hypothetical protein
VRAQMLAPPRPAERLRGRLAALAKRWR